jgi:hypothetical protein
MFFSNAFGIWLYNLHLSTIIQTINPIENAAIASYITCCLINKVDNITSIESIVISIFIHLGELDLVSSIAKINRKEYKQWMLGRQFIPGSSNEYIILTTWLDKLLSVIFALTTVFGKEINITPAINVVITKVIAYL